MKSPIETRLRDALLSCVPTGTTLSDFTAIGGCHLADIGRGRLETRHPDREYETLEYGEGNNLAFLWSDVAVSTYRVDLMLEGNGDVRLAIECDGHDYHDRTKQQAAYDRSRDRELLLCGIPTIRFTGSEIHHSAERCAIETFKIFARLIEIDERPLESWRHGCEHGERYATDRLAEELDRRERDIKSLGFSAGVKHAAEAFSVEFNDLHAEEHF